MILLELHGASSNQLAASLHFETPSGLVVEAVSSSLALFLCSFFKPLPQDCSDSFTDNLMN